MKMTRKMVMLALIFVLITACADQPETKDDKSREYVLSEVRQDDFVLQVYATKQAYALREEVEVFAKLKYIGDKASQTIYHAQSPFYFSVFETTREIGIPFPMDQPGLVTELKKDEWHIEAYNKKGVYSDTFPGYEFHKEFLDGKGYPEGEYRIEVKTDFFTDGYNDGVNKQLSTSITIHVGKH